MNSQNADGKASLAATAGVDLSDKGKGIVPLYGQSYGSAGSGNTSPKIDLLNSDVANLSIDPEQDSEWAVYSKKHRNQIGNDDRKPSGAISASPKAWGQPGMLQKQGMGTNSGTGRSSGNNWETQKADLRKQVGSGKTMPQSTNRGWYAASIVQPTGVPPPLLHGWQWASRVSSSNYTQSESSDVMTKNEVISELLPQGGEDPESDMGPKNLENAFDDDELVDYSDDELLSDYDSDASQKSHETRKKNKLFKAFFEVLDRLTIEQINDPSRQWHCPACHGGPGAIDWYQGLLPLMNHAKTKRSKRSKLHWELAKLLDEELQQRGTSVIPASELFGKWKGLRETMTDHEIVWPPMVVVMNTLLEQDENEMWIGMGNQELIEYFSTYDAVKARHSYGPRGHRGMSVLVFEATAMGYLEAERLHKHFAEQGTDREAWERRRVLFYPGGKRQLYGYMACKEDMDIFNQHSRGKSKLKFEMKSYQEMVVSQMKQMSEDNQQLIWLKDKVAKQKQNEKVLVETVVVMSNQLRIATEDSRIVRLRSKIQHDENKEEMDYMEFFFKDKMDAIHKNLEAKEAAFEKLLQEERENAKQSNADSGSKEEHKLRQEEIARFINCQSKGIEEFESEREKLIQLRNDRKNEMKQRHFNEEFELERGFDAALTQLMEKYTPSSDYSANS